MSALAELRSSRELLVNLTLREIRGKYKRTVLGQAWSLLNPIVQIAIYSTVFGFVLRPGNHQGDPSGTNVFALWLSAAMLPWLFFNNVVVAGMASVLENANLIKKVYFDHETLVISNMLSWLFTHLIEMGVLICAMLIVGGNPLIYIPATLYFIFLLALFGLGVAYALAVANVYFRDTQHFITLFMQMWLYASPIIYPLSSITSKSKKHPILVDIYQLNPIVRFTVVFRNTLYDDRWPSLSDTLVLTVVSVAVMLIGRAIFLRFSPRMAEEL